VIGLGGLQPLGATDDVEVGWWLVPERWGQGLATEVGRAALRFAFDVAGLERVMAVAHPDNLASRRVMERLGMRPLDVVTGAALGLRTPDVPVARHVLDARRGPLPMPRNRSTNGAMARTRVLTMLLAALCATPALAHPGHGTPGWLHHGEILAVALVVLGALGASRWARVGGRSRRERS
jgi:hypothetical protein